MVDTETLIILAGGVASRMRASMGGQGMAVNKGLLRLGPERRPFLDYLLCNAREAGIREVVLLVGEGDDTVRDVYGENPAGNLYHGLRITYAFQPIPEGRSKPWGTADALERALNTDAARGRDAVLVCNSDNLYSTSAIAALCRKRSCGAWIDYARDGLLFDTARIAQFGVTIKDADGYLTDIIEKPTPEQISAMTPDRGSVAVSMNLWRVEPGRIAPYLLSCPVSPGRNEKELPVAIAAMVRDHPRSMQAVPWSEHVPDLTSSSDFPAVEEFLRENYGVPLWGA